MILASKTLYSLTCVRAFNIYMHLFMPKNVNLPLENRKRVFAKQTLFKSFLENYFLVILFNLFYRIGVLRRVFFYHICVLLGA